MLNKITKLRVIVLVLFIVGSIYFSRIGFNRSQVTKETTRLTTKRTRLNHHLDFVALSRDLREYASTRNRELEDELFPWWFDRQSGSFSENDQSKGIVICTGDNHFRFTLVALRALELIGNELPIEVVYSTPNDLSKENRENLEKSFPNIRIVDLSNTSIDDRSLQLRGWEIKPFAVLASRFRHVLLMDADVLFLDKPSILFQNSFYLKTGTLFFYDRVTLSDETLRWIRTLLSQTNNRSLPQRTQESGVVLIDKARVLVGLLSTCKLNDHQERKHVTYRHLYGDKDTWWLGFHLIEMSYSFIPTLTGSIGHITDAGQKVVCGHILHFDENLRPIWWNGGLFKNRYYSLRDLVNIEGWLYEGHWQIRAQSCLTNTGQQAKRFNEEQQVLIKNYRNLTRIFFNINR